MLQLDDVVCTILADDRRLGGGPNNGDHPRTEQMGNLNASQVDAAGGARHEHGFAGLRPRTIDQGIWKTFIFRRKRAAFDR
jgi:hypothetical protein